MQNLEQVSHEPLSLTARPLTSKLLSDRGQRQALGLACSSEKVGRGWANEICG